MNETMSRRQLLAIATGATACVACNRTLGQDTQLAEAEAIKPVARYVHPKMRWSHTELNEFLDVLPHQAVVSMQKALKLIEPDATNVQGSNDREAIDAVRVQLLNFSSNIATYYFRDENKINYHELVRWVARDAGVDNWILETQPTFVVERAIQEKLFVDIWDKLSPQQRADLLKKIDSSGEIDNPVVVASLSGAGALAALSLTVHLTGFAFYTTMSTVICAVAGWLGVTLPFAAYAGASTLVAFLTGPVGWALIAIAVAAGIAITGRAKPRETAAAICQIHAIKVAALQAAGNADPEVFEILGDPVKRQLVGRWRVRRDDELVDLTLNHDGTFLCHTDKDWDGKGKWFIREKRLSIQCTHSWRTVYWTTYSWNIIDNRNIENMQQTAIELEGGVAMARL